MAGRLKDMRFTDVYIGASDTWLKGVPGSIDPQPAPSAYRDEVREMRTLCEQALAADKRDEYPIRHDGVSYRVSIIDSLKERVFVLRRFPDDVPRLAKLGIHSGVVRFLLRPGLTGLIVVSGAFGQGKTTTASSIVVTRLDVHGGVAVTVEDPPEMPLEGRHKEGVCWQTWVGPGEFAEACRKAMRWAPSMILLGEVRDAETAMEALRASINGRLVICTTHADNPAMAVERIFALAAAKGGNSDDVANLLGSGLSAVIHQQLENHEGRTQLLLDTLFVEGEDVAAIRSTLAQRKFGQLGSIITAQKNRLLTAGALKGGVQSPAAA